MKNEVTKKTLFVLEVAFIYGILANIGHPVTPAFLNQLMLPSENFGYFFAAMNLGILLTAPLWGAFGDTKNRKRMVCIGLIIYAIGQILFGLFDNTFTIIIARFISGIGNGAIAVNMLSYINTSSILKEKRKEVTSSYIVCNVIGASVGSALGGIIGGFYQESYDKVFYIQGILLLIYAIVLLFIHNTNDEIKGDVRSKNPFNSLKDIKKINSFYLIFLIILFLIGMSFTNISKYLDVYFTDIGYTTTFIGIFNLFVGACTLLTNLLVLPRLRKYNNYNLSIVISILCAVSVFLSFNTNQVGIFTFYFIYIIGKTLLEPLTVSTLTDNKQVSTGILMGVRQSFISLGAVVGIIVAGYIYSYNALLLFNICAIFFIVAALTLFLIKNMEGR